MSSSTVYGPYPATVTAIHDGDTFHVDVDLGFGIHATEFQVRVHGINAPELATAAGKAALAYLESILPIGAKVTVLSYSWDKYAPRFDADVHYGTVDIGQAMLDTGHAVPLP